MTDAEHDRALVIDRIAAAIWEEGGLDRRQQYTWNEVRAQAVATTNYAWACEAVAQTLSEARSAVRALMLGSTASKPGALRLALAGEHLSGLQPLLCAEVFDAMLTEVLA